MHGNDYQRAALRTAPHYAYPMDMITNGVMGLAGEAGECVDMVKKARYQGHDLDTEHLAKELGDLCWYVALTAYAIGFDMDTIMERNVEKLKKRYPEGFSAERSRNREEGDV